MNAWPPRGDFAPSPWREDCATTELARVLVVDDEVNARTALVELLREEGYSVEAAADGRKALPRLAEFAPDVLVTDLKMPGIDGLELMRRGRQRDPDLAVVVMTAFGAVETAIAAMRAGAGDYLTKPIHVEELMLVLARELERRRLRAEAARLRRRLAELEASSRSGSGDD
jgi:two-component system response regulator HydG